MPAIKSRLTTRKLIYLLVITLLVALTPLYAAATTWTVNVFDCVGTDCSNAFQPKALGTASDHPRPGDTVIWTNRGTVTHSVEGEHAQGDYEGNLCQEDFPALGGTPGQHPSGILTPGGTYSYTFHVPAFCYYRCIFHGPPAYNPPMEGVINVSGTANATTTTTTTTTPTTTTTTTTTASTTTTTACKEDTGKDKGKGHDKGQCKGHNKDK